MNPARWPRVVALGLIRFYQGWLSPLLPPSCFFYPTCSHYTYQAIERFGLWRGGWLGVHRLCRCHPLARGGYDPVPPHWSFWPRRVEPSGDQPSDQSIAPSDNLSNAGSPELKAFELNQVKTHQVNDVVVVDAPRDLDE